jgi:hypothetical protein
VFESEGIPLWSKQFSKFWYDVHIKKWNIKLTNETIIKDFGNRCEWVNSCGIKISDKCCILLKEDILNKHKTRIVGLRSSEKGRRSMGHSKEYDFCVKNKKNLFKPIFDISDSDLLSMEKILNIKSLSIYNYLSRTGCVFCGFGTKKQLSEKINYLRWYEPARAKFFLKYFEKYLKFRNINNF